MNSCDCEENEDYEPCIHQRKSINKFKNKSNNKKVKVTSQSGWIHSENGWSNWYAITGLPEGLQIRKIITEDNQVFEIEN